MRLSPRFVWLAIALSLAACGPRADHARNASPAPRLVLVDSVAFAESDTAYLGHPMYLAVGALGDFYVSDAYSARVLRFGRHGKLRRIYGRQGSGPGELHTPFVIAFAGDSLLLVEDALARRAVFYNRATGAYVRGLESGGFVTSAAIQADTAWLGARDVTSQTGVIRWNLRSDSMVHLVRFPPEYVASPALAEYMEVVRVARWRDTLVVAYSAHNPLLVVTEHGAQVDTVEVPAVRRRGVPASIVQEFNGRIRQARRIAISSTPFALHRMAGGGLVIVHFDQEYHATALITATGYVTVIAPDWRRACIDGPLTFAQDVQPRVAFHGDTLFTLEQHVVGDRAVTFSKAYLIDTTGCDWRPIRRARGAPA